MTYKRQYTKEEHKHIVITEIRRLEKLGNKIDWLFVGKKPIEYIYKMLKIRTGEKKT